MQTCLCLFFVCTACTQIYAHVKDPKSICRKRVGLTTGDMETRKHRTAKPYEVASNLYIFGQVIQEAVIEAKSLEGGMRSLMTDMMTWFMEDPARTYSPKNQQLLVSSVHSFNHSFRLIIH